MIKYLQIFSILILILFPLSKVFVLNFEIDKTALNCSDILKKYHYPIPKIDDFIWPDSPIHALSQENKYHRISDFHFTCECDIPIEFIGDINPVSSIISIKNKKIFSLNIQKDVIIIGITGHIFRCLLSALQNCKNTNHREQL